MRIFLIALIIGLPSILFAQDEEQKVPFVSYWSVGNSYDFQITKIKQQWKEGELTKNDSTTHIANFEVIDSTETSYKIRWKVENDLSEYNIPEKFRKRFAKYEMTEVIYETDELGIFKGIENWQEISKNTKALFEELIDVMSEDPSIDKKELTKVMQPLISVYESKEGIERLVFKEINYFHFPFGLEYSIDEPIVYEELLPNMFGGDPIKGDAKIYFEKVDFENSYCLMVQEMQLNPDDTRDVILSLLKKMGIKDKDMKKAMKTAKFSINDYNTYEFLYFPGVPIRIEASRETIIDINNDAGKGIEKTIIELIE